MSLILKEPPSKGVSPKEKDDLSEIAKEGEAWGDRRSKRSRTGAVDQGVDLCNILIVRDNLNTLKRLCSEVP